MRDQQAGVGARHGAAEEISLGVLDAKLAQGLKLDRSFHAFGKDPSIDPPGKNTQHLNQGPLGFVAVHVLDQGEEGALTLLGIAAGRPLERDLAVLDIGGGSTEIIVAGPDGIRQVVGLPIGASRLTVSVGAGDPPSAAHLAALRAEAVRIVAAAPDLRLGGVVAVGGTAYGLARVAAGPGGVERAIDRDGLRSAMTLAASEPSAGVAALIGLNTRRARILPAGGAIVEALMDRYRIERIEATEASIRDGLVLALVRDGSAWRDRLGAIVRGG